MNRTPPTAVRRQLRREVGFGCPAPDCGNPYLSWHHFDLPWEVEEHHNPEGMIALCREHHDKADAGAYTKAQLRELKRVGQEQSVRVNGRFDWMRRELLVVAGTMFAYRTPVIVRFKGEPAIWVSRDDEGYLMLNLRMLSASGQPRARIEDNYWLATGEPEDIDCPPNGRTLHIKYGNGDMVRIEFFELPTIEAAEKRYPDAGVETWGIPFPITAVETHMAVGGTDIVFGPRFTQLAGVFMQNCFVSDCAGAIDIR